MTRKEAIARIKDHMFVHKVHEERAVKITEALNMAISALEQPERTEYIPETKAIPSERDCVDLSEKVTATYYDDEHEEWSQKTVTIRDVLDSVCDEYTVLTSAQPEYKPVTAEDFAKTMSENTLYGFMAWHGEAITLMNEMGFVICKKTM